MDFQAPYNNVWSLQSVSSLDQSSHLVGMSNTAAPFALPKEILEGSISVYGPMQSVLNTPFNNNLAAPLLNLQFGENPPYLEQNSIMGSNQGGLTIKIFHTG